MLHTLREYKREYRGMGVGDARPVHGLGTVFSGLLVKHLRCRDRFGEQVLPLTAKSNCCAHMATGRFPYQRARYSQPGEQFLRPTRLATPPPFARAPPPHHRNVGISVPSACGVRRKKQAVKGDVHLASISGGTDILGCFALGNPILPVRAGHLQCLGLGMDVCAYRSSGSGGEDGGSGGDYSNRAGGGSVGGSPRVADRGEMGELVCR